MHVLVARADGRLAAAEAAARLATMRNALIADDPASDQLIAHTVAALVASLAASSPTR
jgi:hypothetical protein